MIYTRKWFPLQGELAPLTKMLHFNKPIQISSMLADIFQDTFAGEGEGGDDWRLLLLLLLLVILLLRLESLLFPSS